MNNVPFRLLVADDQPEVARSLLQPLMRAADFVIEYVNADDAFAAVESNPVADVLIVDMQMPPGQWGGLKFIERTRALGVSALIIVVSGEGRQEETIKANRLGANDWVTKERAFDEALPLVLAKLATRQQNALHGPSTGLPLPIRGQVANFHAVRQDAGRSLEYQWALTGALEAIWRFSSMVGLSALARAGLTLPGFKPDNMMRPTMGTYAYLLKQLKKSLAATDPAAPLLNCVDLRDVDLILAGRNRGLAHAMEKPTLGPKATVAAEQALGVFLRRFIEWSPGRLVRARPLDYDGQLYTTCFVEVAVTHGPELQDRTTVPVNTRNVYWAAGSKFVNCSPWLQLNESRDATLMFDGVKEVRREPEAAWPFLYASGQERIILPAGGRYQSLLSVAS